MAPALRRSRTPVPIADEQEAPQRRMRPAQANARAQANKPFKQERTRMTATTEAYGNETVQEEILETRAFPPGVEPEFVRVGVGKTINMGNYESLRIDVSVTSPCLPGERNDKFEELAEFVADKLLDEEAEWLGSAKPKAKRR